MGRKALDFSGTGGLSKGSIAGELGVVGFGDVALFIIYHITTTYGQMLMTGGSAYLQKCNGNNASFMIGVFCEIPVAYF